MCSWHLCCSGVLRGLRYLDSQPPPRTGHVEAVSSPGAMYRPHCRGRQARCPRATGAWMRTFDVVVIGAGPAGEVAAGRLGGAGVGGGLVGGPAAGGGGSVLGGGPPQGGAPALQGGAGARPGPPAPPGARAAPPAPAP